MEATETDSQCCDEASPQLKTCPKYKKTVGHATMAGELFEVKMTLLLFLRGINKTSGFHLASNVEGAGAFDDIVFQYKDPNHESPVTKTCFVQLKSKEKKNLSLTLLSNPGGDFSLVKYYRDYCQIYERMKTSKAGDDLLFTGDLKHTTFVLYTNATMNGKLMTSKKITTCYHPDRALLSTNKSDEFIFNYCDVEDIRTTSDNTNQHQEFLDNLIIY